MSEPLTKEELLEELDAAIDTANGMSFDPVGVDIIKGGLLRLKCRLRPVELLTWRPVKEPPEANTGHKLALSLDIPDHSVEPVQLYTYKGVPGWWSDEGHRIEEDMLENASWCRWPTGPGGEE